MLDIAREATPEELRQWDKDIQQLAEFQNYEAPTVPDDIGTALLEHDDKVTIHRAQDVEPILEHCKELAATGQAWSPSRELRHEADIPMVIVEQYCAERGITFREFMEDKAHIRAMLNDPALAHFRIAKNVVHTTYR